MPHSIPMVGILFLLVLIKKIIIWDYPPLEELIKETRERFKDNPLTPEERRKYYLE